MSCQGHPVPSTFVPKELTLLRRSFFIDEKFDPFTRRMGRNDSSFAFYQVAHLRGVLDEVSAVDGLRIYLATYGSDGSPHVPDGFGGSMTFVFAPTSTAAGTGHVDTEQYFILNPGEAMREIDQSIADQWVRNFQVNPVPGLSQTKLDILTELSQVAPTDTKSILFNKRQILEIANEISCQGATGAKLKLTSYLRDDTGGSSELRGRTTIQFILTRNIGGIETEFYIDDMPDFPGREQEHPSLNTGSPCPPDNCSGFSLPA